MPHAMIHAILNLFLNLLIRQSPWDCQWNGAQQKAILYIKRLLDGCQPFKKQREKAEGHLVDSLLNDVG
ncbi:hypothetical protein HYU19_04245 [Candidatus Woesearchaeota archaeon]|nr:hypothetical protein [Candidatus Woesearchaeota archaeon]